MSFFQKLFGNATEEANPTSISLAALGVDMHSHVLPGLDDGAETVEQAVALLQQLKGFGYRKLIMTPHVMGDFYRNTPADIQAALGSLQRAANAAGVTDVV